MEMGSRKFYWLNETMLKLNEGEETANSYRGLGGMTNLVE
jgi:hypothetical protein